MRWQKGQSLAVEPENWTSLNGARHWIPSCVSFIHLPSSQPNFLRWVLMLSFHVLYFISAALRLKVFFIGAAAPREPWPPHFLRFLDHTQRRVTVGRTPLDEWSARRRDLYLTTHNTHNRQTSMLPVGFEPTISTGERPQTYALDRAATATGTRPKVTAPKSW